MLADGRMLTFDEARARVLADATRLGEERVALGEADGRVLAEALVADRPLPPFDGSAMDGYALRLDDLAGEPPFRLPVGAVESRAGRPPPALGPGAACRIFTGAALPAAGGRGRSPPRRAGRPPPASRRCRPRRGAPRR